MGDIYSAAQVTLVAAAGSDPSYGFPGVLSPRLIPEAENIQTMWLKPLPRLVQLLEVAESRWASRAWTFQEFYRSRRRLIITDNQVIFVCNSQIRYEIALSGINWPGSDGLSTEDEYWARRWLPHSEVVMGQRSIWTTIDRAAGYLEAYSTRHLTYDSDSLDAIAGALDSLRKDFVYHVWGALFRHAAVHAIDSLSARLRHCNDAYSVREHGRPISTGSRHSTNRDDNELEPVHVSGSRDFQSINPSFTPPNTDQYSALEHGQQVEMALTWYHKRLPRQRSSFPSWSSLGWEGPLSWYRWASDNEESPIVLVHAQKARLHFPKFSCDLSEFVSALQESIDITAPLLEITVRTTKLDLVRPRDRTLKRYDLETEVALEMNAQYKYVLWVQWDVDPASLSADGLVGALLDGQAGDNPESFVLVLAPYGDAFERVGLVHLPESRYLLSVDFMRQPNLKPLAGYDEREAADAFLKNYSWHDGAWWQSLFGDYHPALIR